MKKIKYVFYTGAILFIFIGFINKLQATENILLQDNKVELKDYQELVLQKKILEEMKNKNCEAVLKKLQIKNNCEEVRKIVNAFDNDEVFVATIIHESHFDRMAVNENKDKKGKVVSIDRGIFQLNSYYHGDINGDIDYSIKKAKACKKSLGMSCWVAYSSGAYKKHLEEARLLIKNL